MAKKGPKIAVFWPWRAEFGKIKKKGLDILLLLGCIPNFRKSDLEKMRYERTDRTEIIGPSGKIPGTNN